MSDNSYITIKVGDEDREVFMSFGLLNELSIIVADPSRIGTMIIDPELRSKVLKACLAVRKKSGKIEKAVEDLDDVDISIEDVEKLIGWAMDHVMGFFLRALQKATTLSDEYRTQAEALLSSVTGSASSPSGTR